MDREEFKKWAARAGEWSADYRGSVGKRPVRSRARPGDTLAALPASPPEDAEDFGRIMDDFVKIVPPGLTHWQHPRHFAYFPANSRDESVIAEFLTAAMGVNCMLWQTSPVGTEMEVRMLEWLAQMCGVPDSWRGVIQDTASSANLAAVLTARERALGHEGSEEGLASRPSLRYYMSEHSHSSASKAIALAGVGRRNAVVVPTLPSGSMDPARLAGAIGADRKSGHLPACVMAVVGSTSTGGSDDLRALGEVVRGEGLYGHVDAAWAGIAAMCPEHRGLIDGLDRWDSYVFNPHKWLGTNFDLSAHYLKDPEAQVRVMSAQPDYLRTHHAEDTVDFSNWTAPLGRRFRALKLWFVIRSNGVEGLRKTVRDHVSWGREAAEELGKEEGFAIERGPNLSLFVFRHLPGGIDGERADAHNMALLEAINADGFCYLTPTKVDGRDALRFQVGTIACTRKDVQDSVARIAELARGLA